MLVTGSWDKTLKYWDTRTPTATATVPLPERVYCMDVVGQLQVVGCADKKVYAFDVRNPSVPVKQVEPPLKYQSRTVACFPNKSGFALGSIEGRVAINYINDAEVSKNFAFKCHREAPEVFAVNAVAFHPAYGTFATCGSDGSYQFWDMESKHRLKSFTRGNAPVSCANFSHDGALFAYGVSYDWGKGAEAHNPTTAKNYVMIHAVQDSEIKPRAKTATKGRK